MIIRRTLHSGLRTGVRLAAAIALSLSLATGGMGTLLADGGTSAVRILTVDGQTGVLQVVDPETGAVVGSFSAPVGGFVPLYASHSGQYLLANHYEGQHVTVVDSGLRAVPHGDHTDLVKNPPFVRATLPTPAGSAHYWTEPGRIFIYHDGDGSVTMIDESSLETDVVLSNFSVGPADHASIAVIDDSLLVAFGIQGRIDAFDFDGTPLQASIADCPGAHGEGRVGDTIAFACDTGIALVRHDGEQFVSELLPYPDSVLATPMSGTPAAEAGSRTSFMAWEPEANLLVGDYDDGLLLIDPIQKSVTPLSLGSPTLWLDIDPSGTLALALTSDGNVHAVDLATGEVEWTTLAVTPYDSLPADDAIAYYPFIAATDEAVYIPDPTAGAVVEVDLESGTINQSIAVDGNPARLAAVEAEGIVH